MIHHVIELELLSEGISAEQLDKAIELCKGVQTLKSEPRIAYFV